jgi:mannose-6-phosphate isomerase-like protein (cupin superfamily)
MTAMSTIRKTVVTGLAVVAIGAGWLAKTVAQDASSYPFVTVFDHEKVDASFAKAVSAGGSMVLFRRTTPQGVYRVNTQSRESVLAACPIEGCSHEGFTAIVYVVSGAATLVIGGPAVAAKTAEPDKFGGEPIQPGESHRISKGDVIIVPPGRIHWYKNVEVPFRYLEVQTP